MATIPSAGPEDRRQIYEEARRAWAKASVQGERGLKRSSFVEALFWLIQQVFMLPITLIQLLVPPKPRQLNTRAVFVDEDKENNLLTPDGKPMACSKAIRNALAPEPVTTLRGASTLRELFEFSCADNVDRHAIHVRPLKRELKKVVTKEPKVAGGKPETTTFTFSVLDNRYTSYTYGQFFDQVRDLGAGLSHIVETHPIDARSTYDVAGPGQVTVPNAPTPTGSDGTASATTPAASAGRSRSRSASRRGGAASASSSSSSSSASASASAPSAGRRARPHVRHVMLYAETRAEWMQTAQACFRNNITVVTSYATLGVASLAWSFHLTDTRVCVTEEALLRNLVTIMNGQEVQDGDQVFAADLSHLNTVVYIPKLGNGQGPDEDAKRAIAALQGRSAEKGGPIRVLAFNEVVAMGREHVSRETDAWSPTANSTGAVTRPVPLAHGSHHRVPKPSSTAVIMFTSGTTGLPKGVQVSHSNLLAAAAGIGGAVAGIRSSDVYVAYLPLAHILELAAETALLGYGASLGYATTKTITDTAPGIPKMEDFPGELTEPVRGDAPVLRPTLMAGVPAIFERVRSGVLANVTKASPLQQKVFWTAFNARNAARKQGKATPLWNALVFDKIRTQALGGRLRLMLSGGGPLEPATEEFFSTVFAAPILQGYGLTETCAAGTVNWCDDIRPGRVGPPVLCSDIKLVDWAEGGYTHTDRPNPRGEIYIGGPTISAGYFHNPEKTMEAYIKDTDGKVWFATGDIGELHPGGIISIIDRRKDLFKLAHGEYIAPSRIENALLSSPYVENVMIYADSRKASCLAVIVPKIPTLRRSHPDLGPIPDSTNAAAVEWAAKSDVVRNLLLGEVKRVAAERKFMTVETPSNVLVSDIEWLPGEMLTESMKIKRHLVTKRFKPQLDALYDVKP